MHLTSTHNLDCWFISPDRVKYKNRIPAGDGHFKKAKNADRREVLSIYREHYSEQKHYIRFLFLTPVYSNALYL